MPSPTRRPQPPVKNADRTAARRTPVAARPRALERRQSEPARERVEAAREYMAPIVSELPVRAAEAAADDTW